MDITITQLNSPDGGVIAPIKALRAATGLGLRETKEACDKARDGIAVVVTLSIPLAQATPLLEPHGFRFHTLDTKATVLNFLQSLPRHLTVHDILAVLEGV